MAAQTSQEAAWSACAHLRSAGSRPCRLPNCCGRVAHRGAQRVRRWPVLRARRRGTRLPASSWAWAFCGLGVRWMRDGRAGAGGGLFGADGARLSGRTDVGAATADDRIPLPVASSCSAPHPTPSLTLFKKRGEMRRGWGNWSTRTVCTPLLVLTPLPSDITASVWIFHTH